MIIVLLRGVNFNNNSRFSKLSGKKQEEAYEALVQLCLETKGTFSSTGCQHGDKFVQMLVDGALKPGTNPSLTSINLESNHITNPGFQALALAVRDLPNLTTIKLRHQIVTPSVPIQTMFLEAMEKNRSIITMGLDMNRELGRRRDNLESKNRDLRRQKRLERARASSRK